LSKARSPKPNQREDSANGFRQPHFHLPYSPAYCNNFPISRHPKYLNYKLFNVLAFLSTPASFGFTSVHENYHKPIALPCQECSQQKNPISQQPNSLILDPHSKTTATYPEITLKDNRPFLSRLLRTMSPSASPSPHPKHKYAPNPPQA
jgi:hypothetical protein